MIAIILKWHVKPQYADQFPQLVSEFTQACRAEPGCLWFEWARSVDDPNVYLGTEAYADAAAGKAHVESEHFKKAMATQGEYAARRPQIVSVETPGDGWSELGEIQMDD
ncbi:putative quinol monooxygenase [Nigerium sp.]|uniref:putative quinol monooxygenase n=1 Tax=Nigerium sp. TaxID=2042655 RepID=UPI0032216B92